MTTLHIEALFDIGEIVYLRTDTQQLPWQIISFHVYPGYTLRYELSQADKSAIAYDFELSKEKVPAML